MTQSPTFAPHVPLLTGDRVTLRAPEARDVATRMRLGRDDRILAAYGLRAADLAPLGMAAAQRWLEEQVRAQAWMIEADGQMIGSVRLHSLVEWDRRAQIAIGLVDPDAIGLGYGTEAMAAVITHAFGAMSLHRLSLRVLADNARAQRCYIRLGFREEGRERDAAKCWDGWRDDILMGLLAPDWQGDAP